MASTPAHTDVDDRGTARDTYRCEKNAPRDAGRSLAAARDGRAYRATLEELLKVYKSALNVKAFANLRQSLYHFCKVALWIGAPPLLSKGATHFFDV